MTPEQIKAIEAKIAEKMGWTPERVPTFGKFIASIESGGSVNDPPAYLSDPAASRELREALSQRFNYELYRYGCTPCFFGFRVTGESVIDLQSSKSEELAVAKVYCKVNGIAWPEEG